MDSEEENYYDSDSAVSDQYSNNNDNYEVDESEQPEPSKKNCTVLSEADICQCQIGLIDSVSTMLSIAKSDASILLRHYHWSEDRVQEAWFSDEDRVRTSIGLFSKEPIIDPPVNGKIRCDICFGNKQRDKIRSTSCGHPYCLSCWKRYVNISIRDGPGCLKLRCPAIKCGVAVDQDMIYELVYSNKEKEKYDRFFIGSYVEGNEQIKWCPGPGCEYAIKFDGVGDGHDVFCLCGHVFCWNCEQDAHRPVDCDTVAKWMEKNESESENTNWILAYTKPCPKCKRTIEKNEGCMHMTCRDPCNYHFCWLCLEAWSDHKSFYECNRYEKDKLYGKLSEEEKRRDMARVNIVRYTHYYERWNANDISRKKALEDLHKVDTECLEQLSERIQKPVTELEFIKKAWLQIVECQRVLKWTYAYGYYMPKKENAKKRLFEYLQGEAEAGLERLHHCVEKELGGYFDSKEPSGDFSEFGKTLTNLTRVTATYFENLVKALENGLSDVHS